MGVWRPSDRSDDCDNVDCCEVSSISDAPSGPLVVLLAAGEGAEGGGSEPALPKINAHLITQEIFQITIRRYT